MARIGEGPLENAPPLDAPRQAGGRVLIVDDTLENRDALSRILKRRGFETFTASDGVESLAMVREHRPDVILMDVSMPGMSGYDACKALKADAATAGIPIIFLSAHSHVGGKVEAFRVGGADYIVKPFHSEEVLVRLAHQMDLVRMRRALDAEHRALEEEMGRRMRMEEERRLASRLEAVGQLAAGIAHEINTPIHFVGDSVAFLKESFEGVLGLIAGYQEGARLGLTSEELQEWLREAEEAADLPYLESEVPGALESISAGVKRVAEIVGALRAFGRIESEGMAPTDLGSALRNALALAQNSIRPCAVVHTEAEPIPPVTCHSAEIQQVFLHLLLNAAHAVGEAGGTEAAPGDIWIRVKPGEPGEVVVEVEDSGIGIPESIRHRIFDPFFTTKALGQGTGQGLALVRTIVEGRHHGRLEFTSEVGRGTSFRVHLPIEARQEGGAHG